MSYVPCLFQSLEKKRLLKTIYIQSKSRFTKRSTFLQYLKTFLNNKYTRVPDSIWSPSEKNKLRRCNSWMNFGI